MSIIRARLWTGLRYPSRNRRCDISLDFREIVRKRRISRRLRVAIYYVIGAPNVLGVYPEKYMNNVVIGKSPTVSLLLCLAYSMPLACSNPGVYRVVIGHSAGSPPGVTRPTTCGPVAYFGSLGLNDIGNNSQATQTDQFAGWNGCTIETLPTAPSGGHVCTDYNGCPEATPVRWCSYDGGHTSSTTDSGQPTSWMPSEVWSFVSQF